ncbi:MAG: hypothetical protein Q4Q28_01865 [Bacteroidales bacterium]|nr:hypothetical protein [Bacteroidales bacterium]
MKEKNDILSTIGKDSGFKVPENYFSDFAEKMAKSLPDQEIQPIPQPTRWQRVRPFVYMAAMFAGIWCMMQIFNGISSKDKGIYNPEIVAGFQNEANVDDFMLHGDVSEYDILTYEDSVAAEDFATLDSTAK